MQHLNPAHVLVVIAHDIRLNLDYNQIPGDPVASVLSAEKDE